jgi:tryptophanase
MSRDQWAAIQLGDNAYAGSPSWFKFKEAVTELFPFKHLFPTHQVRVGVGRYMDIYMDIWMDI